MVEAKDTEFSDWLKTKMQLGSNCFVKSYKTKMLNTKFSLVCVRVMYVSFCVIQDIDSVSLIMGQKLPSFIELHWLSFLGAENPIPIPQHSPTQ